MPAPIIHNARTSAGFTLVEMLTVLGLFALIAGLGLFISMDAYRSSSFHSERDLVIALLEHARAQAVNNICTGGSCADGLAHGLEVTNNTYTVFQGSSYASRDATQDQIFDANPTVTLSGDAEVVFAQLTGAVASPKVMTFREGEKVSTTTVELNGRIWWTH